MPVDIRNFFGANGGGAVAASTPSKTAPKTQEDASKMKGRRSRKIVEDDSEEEESPAVTTKQATPQKPRAAKLRKESPNGEATSTSDYFASGKPKRSTPAKPKKAANDSGATTVVGKNDTPRSKGRIVPEMTPSSRASSRKKSTIKYKESDDNDAFEALLEKDPESGDDIFASEHSKPGRKPADRYVEEDDKMPTTNGRKASTQVKKQAVKREDELDFEDGDVQMHDADSDSDAPVLSSTKVKKAANGKKDVLVTAGRKRKSTDLEDEDEDGFSNAPRKTKGSSKKTSPSKPPAKKPRAQTKKEEKVESKEIQDIFNSIPTIRPPTPPPRDENKKFDYKNFSSRSEPPPGAGSKDVPVGADNCLAGLTFVFTGILESLGREEGQNLVKRYGGKVTGGPSSKTSYVVLGSEAGPKKLETIAKLGLKTINEDGLFELIRRLPANGGDGKAAAKFQEQQQKEEKKIKDMAAEMDRQEKEDKVAAELNKPSKTATVGKAVSQAVPTDDRLWTVKYAPSSMSMICGNKGQVEKLQMWLHDWRKNARKQFRMAGASGTGVFRAVMIHGPPGIGKTTAAHLVAKLEGYDVIESNASDTRSKKLVENGLHGVLDTTSLLGFFAGEGKQVEAGKKKIVLIMDEVDGMSAGDRGGVGALAAVAKKTNVPMILICNERRLPKMRPFDHCTYDLQFRKPTTDQVRARLMTICYREKLNIPKQALDALIEGSGADIRRIINMISTAKLDQQAMDFEQGKQMTKQWEKHVILKPWDIASKILNGQMFSKASTATLNDKIELYFNDHEFSSLMLQENYLKTNPTIASQYQGKERNFKLLEAIDNAAESISDGDLIDRMIHGSQQQWSLMPNHAVASFVRPASFVSGNLQERVGFTSWLGNNSKQGKLTRFVKEIQGHMRLRASGDRHEIRQQYLPVLWRQLVTPLQIHGKDEVGNVIDLMDSYFLTREDWDAIVELGLGPMDEENAKLDTATKSAFTRVYNQRSHPLPFMKASNVIATKKISRDKPDLEEAIDESDEEEEIVEENEAKEEEGEDMDIKKDKYIKAPKKKKAAAGTKKGAAKKGKRAHDDDEEEDGTESEEKLAKKPKGSRKTKGKA